MLFRRKLYKEYLSRKARQIIDATNSLAFYEVNGAEKIFRMKSGKLGVFELISWLPYQEPDEPYKDPLKAHWMLVGYKDDKKVEDLSFKEFKVAKKSWKKNGDII